MKPGDLIRFHMFRGIIDAKSDDVIICVLISSRKTKFSESHMIYRMLKFDGTIFDALFRISENEIELLQSA
jgi:hypothetical protein